MIRGSDAATPNRFVGFVLAALCAVLCLPGCRRKENVYAPPPPPEVTVAMPIHRPVTRYLEYTGTTEPYQSVELRARVPGFLDQVLFRPGALVRKGDLLFVIDPRVYEAQARQAEADLTDRNASLRIGELTLARLQEAFRAGAVNQQELDRAVAERDQAAAQVQLAEAALAAARLNVEFTQVRAPIDGRITKNQVDVGNLVGGGGQATVLATIVSTQPLYVEVDASEADVLMVRRARLAAAPESEPGQVAPGEWRPAELATSDSNGYAFRGVIDYVDPGLNPETGTLRVRCRFENQDNLLLPGLFVRLRLFLDTADAMLVPDTALLTDQNGRYALVVNDQNAVEVRRVKIGVLDGTLRVVQEGLAPTDRIVVNGLMRARPGLNVKPTASTLDPPAAPAGSPPPAPPGSPPPKQAPEAAPATGRQGAARAAGAPRV